MLLTQVLVPLTLFGQSPLGPPPQTCPPNGVINYISTCPKHPHIIPAPGCTAKASTIRQPWAVGSLCYCAGDKEYCVYMLPNFNDGKGISLVTTSSVIRSVSTLPHHDRWWSTPNTANTPDLLEVKPIEGKGLGVVAANRTIRKNTRVMVDAPGLMIEHGAFTKLRTKMLADLIHEAASMLPYPSREDFFALSGAEGLLRNSKESALAIVGKNAFHTKIEDMEFHAVFLDVSRVNHACSPNAAYHFDPLTMRKSLITVRDIHPGEELTIGYVDLTQPSQTRQASLSHWNFTCSCPRCTQASRRQKESDARTAQLVNIRNELDQYDHGVQDGPGMAELLTILYELEGLEARLHEAYYRAAIEFNGIGNRWKAIKFARLCLERGLLLKDETRPFVGEMRALIEDAEGHWSWRFRLGVGHQD
ncbi:SET domain-containing protein 5 [Podospora pseudocomata]|uniref:SET domain-containing protein 5 n=1 Tax=Podospora pseudocomata TaxID=2093779 RepID=A0ABR0GCA6_9PEZI|nr:SET domain-containing protein 5 [Podospora pseudocomata]